MFDDFDTQIQSDELAGYDYWYEEWLTPPEESEGEYVSPDEYDDWMAYVYATVHN